MDRVAQAGDPSTRGERGPHRLSGPGLEHGFVGRRLLRQFREDLVEECRGVLDRTQEHASTAEETRDTESRSAEIRGAVDQIFVEFQEAERRAANRIHAARGGRTHYAPVASEARGSRPYGFSVEELQALERPWGPPPDENGGFVHGFVVDGAWGTVEGFFRLFNPLNQDEFTEAWKGVGQLIVGSASYQPIMLLIPEDAYPEWLKESRDVYEDFAKAFVAWDHWGSDNSRAAGIITFNALTLGAAGLTKLGNSGRLGPASTTARVAGEVGRLVDPMTYVTPVVRGSLTMGVHLRNIEQPPRMARDGQSVQLHSDPSLLPDGTAVFRDGTVVLPDNTVIRPDNTVVFADGDIARKLPDGTFEIREGPLGGKSLSPQEPLSPREMSGIWSDVGEVQRRYGVDRETAQMLADSMTSALGKVPWGQIDEATRQPGDDPSRELQPDGPR
jgi:hypothetical protein